MPIYFCASKHRKNMSQKTIKRQTKAIHTQFARRDAYGAISMPVYNTVAYQFDDAKTMSDAFCGRIEAPDYSRVENPTVTYFESKVKAITGATHVTAFNSGMAAIASTFIALAGNGKNIVASKHLFGNTFNLITRTLARFGVEARVCNMNDVEQLRSKIDDNTCCVFLEAVSNPQLEVADLQQIAQAAHACNVPLIVDSTAIPFTETHLADFGVDIELVSSTKYVSGGATSLGGLVIDYGTVPGFHERIAYEILFNLGSYMTPHAAYMQTLGLETLDARYRVQSANALKLAKKLQKLKSIKSVNYIGLPDNPYYERAQRQFGPTGGAMLTIDLADRDACFSFLNRLQLILRANNLFDNKTRAIHPASTIFGNFTNRQLSEVDVKQTTIRLSVGLEDVDDIFNDIKQALG